MILVSVGYLRLIYEVLYVSGTIIGDTVTDVFLFQ